MFLGLRGEEGARQESGGGAGAAASPAGGLAGRCASAGVIDLVSAAAILLLFLPRAVRVSDGRAAATLFPRGSRIITGENFGWWDT